VHGFLTRDGAGQDEFRGIARRELIAYPNVRWCEGSATRISPLRDGHFRVGIRGAAPQQCRKVLLATGVFDRLPPIPGIEDYFGTSAHPCPYCDGWEARGSAMAVYGRRQRGFEMARAMTAWSPRFVLCTDGRSHFDAAQRRMLRARHIELIEDRIERLKGRSGKLEAIVFKGGRELARDTLFFDTPSVMQSELAKTLGCAMTRTGRVRCGEFSQTNVPGIFVAGNMAQGVQLSIVAAADGARAAFGINRELTREDFATA
jgi:thioredoxin reductase